MCSYISLYSYKRRTDMKTPQHQKLSGELYSELINFVRDKDTRSAMKRRVCRMSTADYILALRCGMVKNISRVMVDFTIYLNDYGLPSEVKAIANRLITMKRKYPEAFSLENSLMSDFGLQMIKQNQNDISTIVSNFPVFGKDFYDEAIHTTSNAFQLPAFTYEEPYDMCTMTYDHYIIILLGGSCELPINTTEQLIQHRNIIRHDDRTLGKKIKLVRGENDIYEIADKALLVQKTGDDSLYAFHKNHYNRTQTEDISYMLHRLSMTHMSRYTSGDYYKDSSVYVDRSTNLESLDTMFTVICGPDSRTNQNHSNGDFRYVI